MIDDNDVGAFHVDAALSPFFSCLPDGRAIRISAIIMHYSWIAFIFICAAGSLSGPQSGDAITTKRDSHFRTQFSDSAPSQ
jgi:hypothetical protein